VLPESRQEEFSRALLDPEAAVPAGVVDPRGRAAPKRLAVYRNNVTVSLRDALAAAFPVVRRIVGEEFFNAMAVDFVRANPPSSPLLMFYGERFPAFLESFPPVGHLAYLPDVARLEQLRREAYHAADAEPLPDDFLASIDPQDMAAARLKLHPAVCLLGSAHPVVSIYEWNTADTAADRAPLPEQGEDVLVSRPALAVEMRRLPPGGLSFLSALQQGVSLGSAAETAARECDGFDLSLNIAGLLQSRIAVACSLDGVE
jgi:hypothetical protein